MYAFELASALRTVAKLDPFAGETITVGPSNTGTWTQSWTLSVYDGLTCTQSFNVIAGLVVNHGAVSAIDANVGGFYSLTGVTTRVARFSAISYATLTAQTVIFVWAFHYEAHSARHWSLITVSHYLHVWVASKSCCKGS